MASLIGETAMSWEYDHLLLNHCFRIACDRSMIDAIVRTHIYGPFINVCRWAVATVSGLSRNISPSPCLMQFIGLCHLCPLPTRCTMEGNEVLSANHPWMMMLEVTLLANPLAIISCDILVSLSPSMRATNIVAIRFVTLVPMLLSFQRQANLFPSSSKNYQFMTDTEFCNTHNRISLRFLIFSVSGHKRSQWSFLHWKDGI